MNFIMRSAVAGLALASFAGLASAQENPVKIGISVSLTGAFADAIKPAMLANEVWVKEVNERGGLLGRPVEITHRDNRSNVDDGTTIYQSFLQSEMDFAFEDGGAFLVQRESTIAEQYQKLFLAPNAFARSLYQRGYKYLFFTGSALSEDINIGLVKLLQTLPEDQRPKSVGYVTIENIAFTSMAKGMQELSAPLSMETVLDVTYPPNLNDATPLVDNLRQAAPDMVVNSGLTNDTLLIARAKKQQGYSPKLMVISQLAGAQPTFLNTFGDTVEGMVYASPWEAEAKVGNNEAFVQAYEAMHGIVPTYNGAQAYARWQILEKAITETKSFDHAVLRDYIAQNEFDTIVGKMKFNENGYSVPDETFITQIQNGKRVIVWPKEHATGELVYPANQ